MKPPAPAPAVGLALALALSTVAAPAAPAPATLAVSGNQRFLVTGEGEPFFWLGDTAWELFHRLDRNQATTYLEDRAGKGFTVVQAVALAEIDGLNTPNPYGHRPLLDNDPARPATAEGPDNDYWDHVDWIIGKANSLGITVALLPTWGDKWNKKWGVGPVVFTPENARAYGEWLGQRYRDASVVWVVGGDRPIENDTHRAIVTATAEGLRAGDGGRHLITFHPTGGQGSAQYYHDAPWLDFNMRQNGHVPEFTGRYDRTREDYDRTPTKPVLDGEPIYEDHPVHFDPKKFGHSTSADARRPLYWNLFTGAFGHTYGHHSIWQMWDENRDGINFPLMPWHEAIHQTGSSQMQHGRRLIESRPFLDRVPDQTVIVTDDRVPTSVPGEGRYKFVATRDQAGTYAFVYAPVGRAFTVDLAKIKAPAVKAWWFDPRDGSADEIGELPAHGHHTFTSPTPGENLDWVLVLDAADKGYPAPGSTR